MEPHWERGYRSHGYWLGDRRIGLVFIGPGPRAASSRGYGWHMDYPREEASSGHAGSLKVAKREIEKSYKAAQLYKIGKIGFYGACYS